MTLTELASLAEGRAHLAILVEPYLSKLLAGEKTIESRWMKHRIAPYGCVQTGDLVYVKKSGGPVVASFRVGWVEQGSVHGLMGFSAGRFALENQKALCVDVAFIQNQLSEKNFAVFIEVTNLTKLTPFSLEKKGMSAWVVL